MKRALNIVVAVIMVLATSQANIFADEFSRNAHRKEKPMSVDPRLIQWIRTNISQETKLPLSFQIPVESKYGVYSNMGGQFSVDGIIERVIVEEGLVIYDGAVRQIVLSTLGGYEDISDASRLTQVCWEGGIGELFNIRAGYPMNNFVYDPDDPEAVSSDLSNFGNRGFIFRIINANGRYNTEDPLDGKREFKDFPTWPTVHWEDWKPVAGENAWIAMAAVHLHHKKYYQARTGGYKAGSGSSYELQLAEELARAAIYLQADNGGIRMAPIGTYMPGREDGQGWYDVISTENNLSWYAAFRMLYQVTGKEIYQQALERMDLYFKDAWNSKEGYFYQGMAYRNGRWHPEAENFATDVQTWGILVLSPALIDSWFGKNAAYGMWQAAKKLSGAYTRFGELQGVGFTVENDRVSVEWTAGAIFAARLLAEHYQDDPSRAASAALDAQQMRQGIETLRYDFPNGRSAYSYSSRRGWIPFGWNSHDPNVLSLASTAWVVLLDADVNPFYLSGKGMPSSATQVAQVSKN